jgi:hypothetical protein
MVMWNEAVLRWTLVSKEETSVETIRGRSMEGEHDLPSNLRPLTSTKLYDKSPYCGYIA